MYTTLLKTPFPIEIFHLNYVILIGNECLLCRVWIILYHSNNDFMRLLKSFLSTLPPKFYFSIFYLIWNDLYRELYLHIICSSRDNFTEWSFCRMGHFDSSIQRRWVVFSRWKLARAQQTWSFWEIRRQMNVHGALNKFDSSERYVLTVMCGPERSHVQWCVSLF